MNPSRLLLPRVIALCLSLVTASVKAEIFQVTRADDPAPDGCLPSDCSLREALAAAQVTPDADTVRLGTGQYFLTRGDLMAFGNLTLEGAGRAATDIIGSGMPAALRIAAQSNFVLRGVRFVASGGTAIAADGNHSITQLDDVDIPSGEVVAGDDPDSGEVHLHMRRSSIGHVAGCIAAQGLCELVGSKAGGVTSVGEQVVLRVLHSTISGPASGVMAIGSGEVLIEDSTVRDAARPLDLQPMGNATPVDSQVRRTRFLGNTGPIRATRAAALHLEDVEFRDNIVDADHLGDPAVLLAEDAGRWRINRALFVGNRGGGGIDGAVVRVLGGADVVMNQVTFYDNGFHPAVPGGFGHAIGVYAASNAPTTLRLLHATLVKAPSLPAGTQGSVLTVRGGNANVQLYNSLINGSCAFGGGGAVNVAEGNVESPSASCGLNVANNDVNVLALQLHLGPLADHGGFTHTFLPAVGSRLVDNAKSTWCAISPLDQRRHLRPSGGQDCDIGATENGALADTILEDGFDVQVNR